MVKKQRKAIGYVRVSVDRDTKVSPDAQARAISEYCERKGWPLVDMVIERGKSAGKGKTRPLFDDMLLRIEAGEANTLVVYKLDRMTRSVSDFVKIIEDHLDNHGAEFVSVSEGFDTTTAMGRGMIHIAAVFAQIERETIAERMRGHYRHQRAVGMGNQGRAPYGYKTVNGRLELEPAEAKWLNEMAGWIIDGVSLRQVAIRLTDGGAPTPRMGNGIWNFSGARKIVLNPHITGLRHDPDVDGLVEAPWEPAVERERWKQAVAVLSDPARRTSYTKERSVLSGILTCGQCGTTMYAHWRDGRRKYRCLATEKRPDACNGVSLFAEPLEEFVDRTVMEMLTGVELPEFNPDSGDDAGDIDTQLDELATAWGRGEISRTEWRSARAALVDRRDTIEVERRRMSPAMVALASVNDVSEAWGHIDIDAKRAVLRDLFDSIVINPALIRRDVEHRVVFTAAD